MGVFRMMLAACVLFEHSVPLGPLHYLNGLYAVEAFFVISGYYMAFVLTEKYTPEKLGSGWVRRFYLSRYLRLYPAYALGTFSFLMLDWIAAAIIHSNQVASFSAWKSLLALPPSGNNILLGSWAVFCNLTIFLQDLGGIIAVRHHQAVLTVDRASTEIYAWALTILNVAWSLGVELLFYLLAPLLVRRHKWQLLILALLGFGFKIYAILSIGNDLPYRMFPFVISDFLLGMLAYKMRFTLIDCLGRHTTFICYCLILVLTTALPNGMPTWAYSFLAIGITTFVVPALFNASKRSKWDNRIGEASYPFYLFHLIAIALIHFALTKHGNLTNTYLISVCNLLLTLVFSYLVLGLENRYLEPYRQKLGRPR
jgi:peptidoglycan/LPS O-acetylase OafA/YrhL